MHISETATRATRNSPPEVNEGIAVAAARSVHLHASAGPQAIAQRLEELAREWDIERIIEVEAPATILTGIALGAAASRRFTALSAIAAGMLLLHSLRGGYPLLPALRRLGVRSAREIGDEVYALKFRRGDFDGLAAVEREDDRAALAWRQAGLR